MEYASGNIYWKKNEEIKNTYPYLTYDASCDVIVVGGGINGAITAYFLVKEGANVIVTEKNIVGYGSTIASSAILEMDTGIELYKLEKLIGINEARKMYELYYKAIDDIEKIDEKIDFDTGFSKKNNIYISSKFMQKANVLREYEARKKAGFNTSIIDNKYDKINLNSGLVTYGAGAIINPYIFTQCLFEYLDGFENFQIFENTSVDNIKCGYDSVICTTNNGFKIEASKLIFSTGIETVKYVDNLPIEFYKNFTIVTKPIKNVSQEKMNFVLKDMQEPYHYLRFTKDGRIIFTGEAIKYTDRFLDEKYFEMIANDRYRRLLVSLQRLLPDAEEVTIEYAYNGTVGKTKDLLPIVDEIPSMPNCFCNLSLGKNSIVGATVGAKMLTNAVRGLYTKEMNLLKINR